MTTARWTPQKRMAAVYAAMGKTTSFIRKQLGVGGAQLEQWQAAPEWAVFVEELSAFHASAMAGLLEDGERLAVITLMDLMEKSQDDDVRFKAAESFLNRAGKRGRPVEQVQTAVLTGNLNDSLVRALRDPGVRARLGERFAPLLDQVALPPGTSTDTAESTVVTEPAGGGRESVSPETVEADYEVVPSSAGPDDPPLLRASVLRALNRTEQPSSGNAVSNASSIPDLVERRTKVQRTQRESE